MRPSTLALATALTAVLTTVTPAAGQSLLDSPVDGEREGELVFQEHILEREYEAPAPLVDNGARYVVVHLEENRVYVFEGGKAIWSAPSGTGTGLELDRGGEHRWKFSTPVGLMRVRRMEKDPVWEAPDWHFLEKGLRPPAQNSPSRRMRGPMGNTAIYLGDGIAIHGTYQPALLLNPDPRARDVSHGCIRLTDEHARELMHMIDVGTPVLIY